MHARLTLKRSTSASYNCDVNWQKCKYVRHVTDSVERIYPFIIRPSLRVALRVALRQSVCLSLLLYVLLCHAFYLLEIVEYRNFAFHKNITPYMSNLWNNFRSKGQKSKTLGIKVFCACFLQNYRPIRLSEKQPFALCWNILLLLSP